MLARFKILPVIVMPRLVTMAANDADIPRIRLVVPIRSPLKEVGEVDRLRWIGYWNAAYLTAVFP